MNNDGEAMPLLLKANTINAAAEAVIRELAARNVPGTRHIVVVPDSYTLSVEKLIPELTGTKGALNVEVASFSRLAAKELKDGRGCLSKEGAVLILKKVINRHADELKHYKTVARLAGFAREMFAVIAALRNNGVSVEMLREAIPKLTGATKTKNIDIALLYAEYLKELSIGKYDSTTRLEAFIKSLPSSAKIAASDVYVLGFDTFSGKQVEIISALARYARSLTVGVVYTNDGYNRDLYPTENIDGLLAAAARGGAPFDEARDVGEKVPEPFAALNRGLFAGTEGLAKNEGDAVVLFKEENIFEEFNAVAHEIARLTRREGYRYKDIAIIDCCPEHKLELKEVLMRYGIPHFIDIRYPMSGSLVYKYLISCIEVARFGLRRDKVFALLKNPLFGADEDEVFLFENYAMARNLNFAGFAEPLKGEGERFEAIRAKLAVVAAKFASGRAPVKEYAEVALELIGSEDFEALLDKALDGVDENLRKSNLAAAEKFRKGILPEYSELIGDEEETLAGFEEMLSASAASEEIALIPRFIDSVYVGKLRESFVYRPRAIFVIGATAGALPAAGSYKAIMSELDLVRMEDAGIRLYPAPADRVREEQFAILDLVTKTDRLYVGYPLTEPDGSVNRPSPLITEAQAVIGAKVVSLEKRFSVDGARDMAELEDVAVSPANAAFEFLMACSAPLPKGEDGERAYEMRKRLYNSLTPAERFEINVSHAHVTPSVPLTGSFTYDRYGLGTRVSQLESYFRCPYAHFLQYGLRLKKRDDGKLAGPDIGILVHAVMEEYFRAVRGKLRISDAEELEAEARKAADKVFDDPQVDVFRTNASSAHLLARLKEECLTAARKLTENVLRGKFDPVYVEMDFGMRGAPPLTVATSFGEVHLRGKIDRVDIYNGYVSVVDYKTGKESGSLDNVYFGKKIQLYVYLSAVSKNLGVKPAGAFYANIGSGFTAKGADYSYKGSVLAEPEVAIAFDAGLAESGSDTVKSDVVPVSLKREKSGELAVKGGLSAEQFAEVIDYVNKLICGALEEINAGYAEKRPLGAACKYCSFLGVCGGAPEGAEREFVKGVLPYGRGEE